METPGLITFVLIIWLAVAVPVTLATFGHLMGNPKRPHLLNVLLAALLVGMTWPTWLFRK